MAEMKTYCILVASCSKFHMLTSANILKIGLDLKKLQRVQRWELFLRHSVVDEVSIIHTGTDITPIPISPRRFYIRFTRRFPVSLPSLFIYAELLFRLPVPAKIVSIPTRPHKNSISILISFSLVQQSVNRIWTQL